MREKPGVGSPSLNEHRVHKPRSSPSTRTRRAGALRAAAAAAMLSLPAAGCLRPGLLEERPEREETTWRPLVTEERKALLQRLAEEKIVVRDEDVAAVRIPDKEPEWLEWSRPWAFRGATVHCQFR